MSDKWRTGNDGNCPYGGKSGKDNHYASKEEAMKAIESIIGKKHNG